MLVLDINVVSELLRPTPDAAVVKWMRHNGERTGLSSVTRAELRCGVARMPAGVRREAVSAAVEAVLAEFDLDTLPFDAASADAFGVLAARRERSGAPTPMADTMIAAICLANGAGVVTRNTADFADAGLVALVNPLRGP